MELEFEERFFSYEEPLDLVNFFRDDLIEGYCNTLAEEFTNFMNKHENLGISPIVENGKFNYLMIDYGFAIWALLKYINIIANTVVDKTNSKEVIEKVTNDFLKETGKNISRNGSLFVNILNYFKLSFLVDSRFFYTKHIFISKQTGNRFFLNSIPMNIKSFTQFANDVDIDKILKISNSKNYELVAFKKSIGNYLAKIAEEEERVKLYSFWSKTTGITGLLKE